MTKSKNPILEIEPYPDEAEWEDFCIVLGSYIKQRFQTGYVKCSAENLGWQHRSGYKVFEFELKPTAKTRQRASSETLCLTPIGVQQFIPSTVVKDCTLAYLITTLRVSPTT